MSDQFSLSFFGDSPDTQQGGSKFERKSDTGIDKNHGRNTEKTWTGPKDPREGKGAGKYPNYWSYKTRSGHVIQYDDSKGNESITIQHRGGSAMQFLPNGAIHMAAHNGKYDVIFGEQRMTITGAQDITVKGEGSMLVYGNYRQTVHGNMEVACTGSYNITAKDMIMHPRDNFTVAAKTGTMKFSDTARISAEKAISMTAGQNIVVNAKDVVAVGGGKAVYVAGKETASMYSDGKTYATAKDELHLGSKKSYLTGSDNLDVKGKETKIEGDDKLDLKSQATKVTGSNSLDLKSNYVKIGNQRVDISSRVEIQKLIAVPIPGGNPQAPAGANGAEPAKAKEAEAQKVSAPKAEVTNMPKFA